MLFSWEAVHPHSSRNLHAALESAHRVFGASQKADEEAAKVYEEFVESFKGDEGPGRDSGVKAFVRGGVVAPGSRSHEATGALECTNHIDLLCPAVPAATAAAQRLFPPLLLPLLSPCPMHTFHSSCCLLTPARAKSVNHNLP